MDVVMDVYEGILIRYFLALAKFLTNFQLNGNYLICTFTISLSDKYLVSKCFQNTVRKNVRN